MAVRKTKAQREVERVLRQMGHEFRVEDKRSSTQYFVGPVRVLVLHARGNHDFIEHETRYQISRALHEAELAHH